MVFRFTLISLLLGSCSLAVAQDGDSLQAMIDRAQVLNTTAPIQESRALLDKLVPLMAQATPQQRVQINLMRARSLGVAGDNEAGVALAQKVLDGQPTIAQRARALELSANLAGNNGSYERAFKFLSAALALVPELDDAAQQAGILGLASYFYSQVGEDELALEYARTSVKLARQTGEARAECVALQKLLVALEGQAMLAEAESTYRDGLAACQEAGDPVFAAVMESGLGNLLRKVGRLDEAEDWLVRAVKDNQTAGYAAGELDSKLFLANLRFEQGNLQQSRHILLPLAEVFKKEQGWQNLALAEGLLAAIADARGNLSRALEHYKNHMRASAKFMSRERSMHLAYLGTKFDVQRSDQQLVLLREQNRVLQLEEEARANRRLLVIGGAVALILIGVLLFLLLLRSQADRRRFRRLSERDSLTNLYNHTQFFSLSEQTLAAARAAGDPFTLVIADIDHFKQINDQHNHMFGDEVLRMVSARMREVFGEEGIVGRIGGEEFGIALRGMTADQATRPIQHFRQRLVALRDDDENYTVTFSFGLAQARTAESLEDLRLRTEQALYRAKHAGRDRVVTASEARDGDLAKRA